MIFKAVNLDDTTKGVNVYREEYRPNDSILRNLTEADKLADRIRKSNP